ncbi:MAG: 1,4-dihydroxy-2-naphthoate polyprenyltransferase [Angustibacter sp.]
MANVRQWIDGARPRTLPAAVAPVAAGTGAAADLGAAHGDRAALALLVALSLQVGVNYANDYADGVRGTDDARLGPVRLTGSGLARPAAVRAGALVAFGIATAAGLALTVLSGAWWFLAVGALSIATAWGYTGGRRPYGYRGLGEVAVFVFFGLVAVLGTTYTQAGRVSWAALAAAVGIGCLACAILVANNLRDIPTDAAAGKLTLAVRLGDTRTRQLYVGLVAAALVVLLPLVPAHPWAAVALLTVAALRRPVRVVRSGATGPSLIPVLRDTGLAELTYGLLLALALVAS